MRFYSISKILKQKLFFKKKFNFNFQSIFKLYNNTKIIYKIFAIKITKLLFLFKKNNKIKINLYPQNCLLP